jgi:ATP-binding cassette subfamily B protein
LLELAVLTVAGFELSKGRITVGAMLAAGQYVLLGATFTSAIGTVTQLARARTAARRTADILDQPPLPSGTKELPPGDGALTVDGVSVHLSGAAVLEGIDLSIAAGTFVAVVGRSGSGKSLLAAVLGRLVVPTEGQVLLDGVELTSLDERVLRSAVAYGFERPFLIGETIEDAIAFGEPTPDLRRVVAAAREARADDFVRRLPLGYQSALSDAPMSAGELQRLGVARAFAHAGRVLILDDVVSSLDTVTEHHIAEALACGLPQLTRVVIAHRVSTAAQADTVIWLERGRLRGMASHADLWQQPDYRALFEPDEAAPPAGNSELEHSS